MCFSSRGREYKLLQPRRETVDNRPPADKHSTHRNLNQPFQIFSSDLILRRVIEMIYAYIASPRCFETCWAIKIRVLCGCGAVC